MIRLLSALLLLAAAPLCAVGQTLLLPVTQFTIHNGGEIDSDPFGFFGYVQDSPDFGAWETFFEFDLDGLPGVATATLMMTIHNQPSIPNTSHTFKLSHYAGSGAPALAPFGGGTLVETLAIDEAPTSNKGLVQPYSIDVTALVASRLADGPLGLGFRLSDPTNGGPSDHVPFVEYEFDSARLVITVPEPTASARCALVAAGVLVTFSRASAA